MSLVYKDLPLCQFLQIFLILNNGFTILQYYYTQ